MDLEASTGNCLIIPVYEAKTKTGALIHFGRDDKLFTSDAELIRKPFDAHPELCESPAVALISSKAVATDFAQQLADAEEVIRSLAPTATFRQVTLADNPELRFDHKAEPMAADVFLETETGRLVVVDAYGPQQVFELAR